jgi:hypothetical protein
MEYWSHGVLEKTIAELTRVFRMICPYHPDFGFVQLYAPSKASYLEGLQMAVIELGLIYAQHSNTPVLQHSGNKFSAQLIFTDLAQRTMFSILE